MVTKPNPKQREEEHRPDRDRKASGDDPRRHAKIIERRWLGSPPPTSERYALAHRQWHSLPGAVVGSATDVTPTPTPTAAPTAPPTGERSES